ncbi:acetolactate synthase small subunit [Desulfosporosinus metallidurans]|uniref:Acetolactate synthase small subunit n=1 Tax=Desulfosporosinus metallidurans TaxID=1888891 RepID=A0A1Q8R042_9FIRM|nr:acetolactate synthase small subunit [Desulfosporosinus metallidurans]OLN32760.1 Acetolactate synthase small subunit [Desulfosporosinus metallidurans]
MLHTLAALVENHPGVLARVAGLFARRAYNIDSLSVCQTENPELSRMTIVVNGDDQIIEQVRNQLNKLVAVHTVMDLTEESIVDRELALVRVKVSAETRSEVLQIVDVFRGRVVDMGRSNITVEITGDSEKLDAFVNSISPYGLVELVRTGKIAIMRSEA